MTNDCVFCEIIACRLPASVLRRWGDAILIEPLGQDVSGHRRLQVIPLTCAASVRQDPEVLAVAMRRAGEVAAEFPAVNLIVAQGADAGQDIGHLCVDLVPRTAGDDLPLPWTHPQFPAQLTALRAVVDNITEPGIAANLGAIADCSAADVLARMLHRFGCTEQAVELLVEHGTADDADEPHHRLTQARAHALIIEQA